jgi:hypothetical protein
MKEFEKYERKAIFAKLKQFCHLAKEDNFIEVTEWANGEGFDVEVQGPLSQRFQMTWGEYDALKSLIKKLNKE